MNCICQISRFLFANRRLDLPSPLAGVAVSVLVALLLGFAFANDLNRSELSRLISDGAPILVACSPDPGGASLGLDSVLLLSDDAAFGSLVLAKADLVSSLMGRGAGIGREPERRCRWISIRLRLE